MKDRGDPVDRVDGRLKVTGGARYAVEVPVEGAVHAVLLVSTVGRGRITRLDSARAERSTGVLAVLTHRNAPRLPAQPEVKAKTSPTDRVLHLLQDDRVHYSNQPIAVVVADTLERARHAASLVEVRYATEKTEVDLSQAHVPEERPQPAHGAEPSQRKPPEIKRGDVEAGLAAAEVRVSATYTTPYEHHNPMETHATTAVWHGDQHLTLYDSTQGIFEVRRKVSQSLGLPKENVRVISHFVGGGFGSKGSTWSHVVLAALAAKQVGRPVRLMVTRPQMFGPVGFRPATEQKITLGATRDGALTACTHESRSTTSRFDEFVEHTTAPTRAMYRCPNLVTVERIVPLDTGTPQFMRAPGESTGSFALESAMDELAVALKMDPLALRRKNHADRDPESGKPWSSKSLEACYARAAEKFGWAKRTPEPRSMREGDLLVGWGMATASYPAHLRGAKCDASLRADGTALVRAGSQDIGTGTYTVMTQVAAEALGLPVDRVRFELGDTELPETGTSGGSMTAASVGTAVRLGCLALRGKLVELARGDEKSPVHGVATDDVIVEGGRLSVRGQPGRGGEPFQALLLRKKLGHLDESYESKVNEQRKAYATRSFGAHFVEVTVDGALGEVRVRRVVSAFAAGRILNEKTARSQYVGGIVWGLGMGLFEQTVHDARTARAMNADLAEYHVPVNRDVPPIDVIFVDEEDPYVNELGVKGIGEIGITGVAAALANAVFHATGRRVRELPITVDKLLL